MSNNQTSQTGERLAEAISRVVLPKKTKRSEPSDIMIVKMKEDSYYVSEKLKGRAVYREFLLKRFYSSSNRFSSIEEARAAAQELKKAILSVCPKCKIVEIDFNDYPDIDQPNIEKPLYDNYGVLLGGKTAGGKLKIDYCFEDEEYRYFYKREYRSRLKELFEAQESKEFDYYTMGLARGYKVAETCSIPYLRFEIFKAEELLKSFEWDKELHACDMEIYGGYIAALREAIYLQKQLKITPDKNWRVYITDMRTGAKGLKYYKKGVLPEIGEYEAQSRPADLEFGKSAGGLELYIVLIDYLAKQEQIRKVLGLSENQVISFRKVKSKQSKVFDEHVKAAIYDLYSIKPQDDDLQINMAWIESLSEFVPLEETEEAADE